MPIINGVGRVGFRDGGPIPRTTLFKDATGITDLTIINALKDLDAGLISTGLDAKIKYLYPFVGGTGDTCKVNFMSPGTKDLAFSGGWTFTSKGIKGNGVNTYANTGISPATNLLQNDVHASIYTATSQGFEAGAGDNAVDFHAGTSGWNSICIWSYGSGMTLQVNSAFNSPSLGQYYYGHETTHKANKKGFNLITRGNATQFKFYKDGIFFCAPVSYGGQGVSNVFIEGQATSTSGTPVVDPIYIGALGDGVSYVSKKEYSFATFGKNLTDTEQATLYILIQNFQYALGRIIGTRIVAPVYGIYNQLTQKMISKFNITDTTIINACNNLEQSFIDNGILPLMDVMYLMVGGTSETCAYNFMGGRWHDLDFKGGWTFASTGAKPNGVNAHAVTSWSPNWESNPGFANGALGWYVRNRPNAWTAAVNSPGFGGYVDWDTQSITWALNDNYTSAQRTTYELGLSQLSRDNSNVLNIKTKTNQYAFTASTPTGKTGDPVCIGSMGYQYSQQLAGWWSNQEVAFAYLSKGQITPAQQVIINTAVNTFQTALSRNV